MYPRFVERRVREALEDTRVVLVCGPRQSGKTTLAQQIAGDAIPFITLDDATAFRAASTDPVGFVRGIDRAVIDEVQRAPDLILAIKATVDADPRPGRFLLTGSADLMTLPRVADSLAGRMGIVRLLPLAQAELRERGSRLSRQGVCGQDPDIPNPDCRRQPRGDRSRGRLPRGVDPFRLAPPEGLASRLHRGDRPTRCPRHRPDRATGLDAKTAARILPNIPVSSSTILGSARRSA